MCVYICRAHRIPRTTVHIVQPSKNPQSEYKYWSNQQPEIDRVAPSAAWTGGMPVALAGRGDDTVGNPRRAQICHFELFELVLLLKLDKLFPVEQFEAAASQSAVPSPLS